MRLLRRLMALLVLLALMIGAPVALWLLGRDLLPSTIPSPAQAWQSLTSQDSGALFMGALVIVGFVAWAVFAFSVIVEVIAAAATLRGGGRRVARFRIRLEKLPLLGLSQSAASVLVSAVLAGTLMAQPAAAASMPSQLPTIPHTTVAAVTSSAPSLVTAAAVTPAATVVGGPVWTVQPGDTLWDIAEKSLGDPLRYPEIVALNQGVTQPDGGQLATASTWLEVGWQLTLPTDATTPTQVAAPTTPTAQQQVTVQPGDTLSQIAQDRMGSADAYPELAAANGLTNPDLIDPGQIIVIPAAAAAAGTPTAPADPIPQVQAPAGQSDPATTPTAESPTADSPTAEVPTDGTATVDTPYAGPHSDPAGPPVAATGLLAGAADEPLTAAAPPATSAPTIAASASPGAATDAPTSADQSQDQDSPSLLFQGLGGVTAAGLLAALLLARRRSHRDRRPGRSAAVASLKAARAEKIARERADATDPAWIDLGLRSMAAVAAEHRIVPDVLGATVGPDGLRLTLAEPLPAVPPFLGTDLEWWLPADAALPVTPDTRDTVHAPLPALTTVAVSSTHTYLLDLERAGGIFLTTPAETNLPAREFLNHLVADLATNLWSDDLTVTMVGWGADLVPLSPHRLNHVPTLTDAIPLLDGWITDATATLEGTRGDALSARVNQEDAADAFINPQVLIVDATAATPDDIQRLRQQLEILHRTHGRKATSVVVTGHAYDEVFPGVLPIDIDAARRVTIGGWDRLWSEAVLTAPSMSDSEIALFVERIALSGEPDQQPALASDPQPWAQDMTNQGALVDPTPAGPAADLPSAADIPSAADVLGYSLPVQPTGSDLEIVPPAAASENATSTDSIDTAAEPVDDAAPAQHEPSASAGHAHSAGDTHDDRVVDIRPGTSDAARRLAATLAADPDLDADLQEWFDEEIRRPRIGILGPVTVTARGTKPRDRLSRHAEFATYLALHPRGVTVDRAATDLWSESNRPKDVTVRELLAAVRKWLGADTSGDKPVQYLPNAKGGVYRLETRLLDSELLRRLRKRAEARLGANDLRGALADLVRGLQLVRMSDEPPVWELGAQPYSWLATIDHPEGRQIQAAISDVCYQAADLAMQLGDLDTARWAAELGHAVTPDSDRPLCQMLLIAKEAGQMETAKKLVDEIRQLADQVGWHPWARDAIRAVFPPATSRSVAR